MATRKLSDLKPNPGNPRTVTAQKKKMLAKSLKRFGDLGGVVFNTVSGQLVGGHQRVDVLGAGDIVITKTNETPDTQGTLSEGFIETKDGRHGYREVAWDADTERAANLAANKGAGEFDMPQVSAWLGELDKEGFDLDLTMFDEDERKAMLPQQADDDEAADDADAESAVEAETRCKAGDIWKLGRHRLMCGDSSNVQHLERLVCGQKVQMVYTDPPYGISLDVDYRAKQGDMSKWKGPKHRKIIGDDEAFDAGFLLSYFKEVKEIFLWGAENYKDTIPSGGSWICWDKKLESHDAYSCGGFELCWSKQRHHYELARIVWTGYLARESNEKRVHPAQKPIKLAEWFFERWGKPGDLVVDLYAGSGSTVLAAEKANRCALAFEIDPLYCDLILARWEKLSGSQAEMLNEPSNRIAIDA